jgi:hypothetical protein
MSPTDPLPRVRGEVQCLGDMPENRATAIKPGKAKSHAAVPESRAWPPGDGIPTRLHRYSGVQKILNRTTSARSVV